MYYGPGLCGKTTNLKHIYQKTSPGIKGKMISLATETDRTLFFDFLPLSLGEIQGFKARFHLYTVPGQVFYDASRKLILKGVDGIIFVADSQKIGQTPTRIDGKFERKPRRAGLRLGRLPFVVQYNKRDLPDVLPVEQLRKMLNTSGVPDFAASATTGEGVFPTLKCVAKQILQNLRKGAK